MASCCALRCIHVGAHTCQLGQDIHRPLVPKKLCVCATAKALCCAIFQCNCWRCPLWVYLGCSYVSNSCIDAAYVLRPRACKSDGNGGPTRFPQCTQYSWKRQHPRASWHHLRNRILRGGPLAHAHDFSGTLGTLGEHRGTNEVRRASQSPALPVHGKTVAFLFLHFFRLMVPLSGFTFQLS